MNKVSKTQLDYMMRELNKVVYDKRRALDKAKFEACEKYKDEVEKTVSAFFKKLPVNRPTTILSVSVGNEKAGAVSNLFATIGIPPALNRQLKALYKKHQPQMAAISEQIKTIDRRIFDFEAECILSDLAEVREKFNELLKHLSE
jgi:hypothetical protein